MPSRGVLTVTTLVTITAFGAVLRFWNLAHHGLVFWDEAKFALEGMRVHAALLRLSGAHASLTAGKAIGTAKPTHALILALGYLVLGNHDWVPLAVDAVASTLAIPATYLIARHLFSETAALMAAALLAVSSYEVLYARSALSESDACLLFLLGVLIWLPDRSGTPCSTSRLLGAAVVLGLALTANYRLLVYVGALGLIDLTLAVRAGGVRRGSLRIVPWALGLAAAPVAWELAAVAASHAGIALFRNEVTGGPETYLHEVLYQIHGGKQSVVRFAPLPYLEWLWLREGPALCVVMAAGVATALVRHTVPWLITLALVAIPFVLYLFAPFIVPRSLEAALPSLCILGGAFFAELLCRLRAAPLGSIGGVVLTLLLLADGTWQSARLLEMRSGFATAAQYVKRHEGTTVLTSTEVMAYYFRGSGDACDAPALPLRLAQLHADVRAGMRYAVLDRHSTPVSVYIRHHARLAASFSALGPVHVGENLISSENADPPDASEPADVVDVFDLRHMRFLPGLGPLPPPSRCRPDHVV
jgi:4-amino-4-deoxy-L-arabinose transferase-like glycosyltransferase